MELVEYIRTFRRWAWLMITAGFIAGATAYVSVDGQVPVYRASATVSIGSFLSSPNPQTGEIRIGQDLAITYAQLVRTFEVLDATVQSLDLPFSADALNGMISTRILPETSLMVIQVEYTDPVVSAEMASELAQQLILLSPTNLTPEQQAQIDIAISQIEGLRNEIDALRLELEEIQEAIDEAESQNQLDELVIQRNLLYEQINDRSGNIANFSNVIAGFSQRTNSVEIVEGPRIPTNAITASPVQNAILAAIVGVSLMGGIVLFIEYLNDTFRTAGEVNFTLDLPPLGVVTRMGRKDRPYVEQLITNNLFSPHFEQYSMLQTNTLLRLSKQKKPTIVISSAMPFEGKTVTAANLSIAAAFAKRKVLLIDCDFRKPKLHEVFELPNVFGFANMLNDYDIAAALDNGTESNTIRSDVEQYVHNTKVPGLHVITSGYTGQNPISLLDTDAVARWVDYFYDQFGMDVVIFDTPPVLVVGDSMVVAERVAGNVILVVEANRTRRTVALRAKERFSDVGHDLIGFVLNRANQQDQDYYGYQGYYYYTENKASISINPSNTN